MIKRMKRRTVAPHVKAEREALLLMGDAARAEYLRRTHASTYDDATQGGTSPLYDQIFREKRYAQGGTQERLRQAARKAQVDSKPDAKDRAKR